MNLELKQIVVSNYKSYPTYAMDTHPKLNAILGLNGVGKTNLLDAIYYSCLGKSYFSSGDRYVMRRGAPFFRIEAFFQKQERQEKFIAKVIPGKKKALSIDGKEIQKIGDHVGRYPCIMIAPLDIQLLLEGSAERRRFLNNTLIQHDPRYIQESIKYNRLLKQRNATLKSFSENKYYDADLLESVSIAMYEPARYIYEARAKLVTDLSPLFSDLYKEISGNRESCSIEYKSQIKNQDLASLFIDNKEKDRILSRTTAGVHKDDLKFIMDEVAIKTYGSQGQLKSFVLALKLAQYHILQDELGMKPLLLLDDIFDKLDATRVSQLLTILHQEKYGQVFLTDKDKDIIVELLQQISEDYRIFVINENTPQHDEEE